MEALILTEKSEKTIFKVIKNNNKRKLVINTILPKFTFVNRKGELEKPMNEVSY